MDLIRDYALPLPTTIIAEMLGVPAADRHRFHRWSNALIAAGSSTWGMVKAVPERLGAHALHPPVHRAAAGRSRRTT